MNALLVFYFFIFGLVFGSFYNVVGLRVPKKESIAFPGSHCTYCNHAIAWYDNIPVFSYLFLKGECRNCQVRISWIYPVMEAVTGLLFAFSYYYFGFSMELIAALLLASLLVIITVSDLAYMIIPNRILLVFLVSFIIYRLVAPLTPWWDSILASLVGFGILYLLGVISKGGMGGGDMKLFFVLGVLLGTKATLLTLFLAALLGSVFGLSQMMIGKFKKRTPIPFGPFIAIAAMFSFCFSEQLINWYIQLLYGGV